MPRTRRKNRLKNKELYQSSNYFFITICTKERGCIFGEVVVGEKFISPFEGTDHQSNQGELKFAPTGIKFSQFGYIIQEVWLGLPVIFENITIKDFVIMPNHFHGIIGFTSIPYSKLSDKETDLSKIIRHFKAVSTLKIKDAVGEKFISPFVSDKVEQGELKFAPTAKYLIQNYHTIWQKSFYDHIIIDDRDLQRIQEYILYNPLKWNLDILNPRNKERYQKWVERKTP